MIPQQEQDIKISYLFILISFAYLFSIAIRLIWVYQFNDVESFYWHDQLMISTNDGYYFASGAQKVLEDMHAFNPRIPDMFQYGPVFFTVLFSKITPFSLETIILYIPSIISSLVVIPMILIGRIYGATLFGFFAALIGSIAWSYYNRTMTGYFDTDMFSAMAPMFILYFLLNAIENEKLSSTLYAALAVLIYPFLYDQGQALIYAMGLIFAGYMIIFHRKEAYTYQAIILIFIGLMPFFWVYKIALLAGLYHLFSIWRVKLTYLIGSAILITIVFLYYSNVFELILMRIGKYAIRGVEQEGLKFYKVSQTVREAGRIPFEVMANRISGSTVGVIASLIGYILLVIKYRPFILALPLIGIGIFSLWGGLRFTVYAVPIAALGAVYLFYVLASFINNNIAKYSLIIILTGAMLYPNITHIIGYKVSTVFNKDEVQTLDQLRQMGSSKDYVITWWDYGYPIWFYADKNTLIDGGKHHHDNYIVSEILTTTSQKEAAYLSRIAVETYVDSNYKIIADTLFKNRQPDQLDVDLYLDELKSGSIKPPEPTRDIYLYLPLRMINILPTVKIFSNLDLTTGKSKSQPFLFKTTQMTKQNDLIDFGRGIQFDQKKNELIIANKRVPVNSIWTTQYDSKGKLHVNTQTVNASSSLYMIFMQSYNQLLILDSTMFHSTYIQMSILERYDPTLFEPVIKNPWTKIYKLKI